MAHRVVLGLDGSASSLQALPFAIDAARASGAVLDIVRAWMPFVDPMGGVLASPELVDAYEQAARAGVRQAVADAGGGLDSIEVHEIVEMGSAVDLLIDRSAGADLLVVGSRGRGGFPGLRIGSVAYGCVHRSHVPILVVPAEPNDASQRDASAPIVVAVDGSTNARAALRWGVADGQRSRRRVRAVLAWNWLDQVDAHGRATFHPDYGKSAAADALAQVIREELDDSVGSTVDQVVVNDLPARAIVDQAKDAARVVLGRRGLSPVKVWLLGSISDQVLRHSTAPVVIVPAATDT